VRPKLLVMPSWYPGDVAPISGIFIEDQAIALSRNYDLTVCAPQDFGWRAWLSGRARIRSGLENRANIRVYRQAVVAPPRLALRWLMPYFLHAGRRAYEHLQRTLGKPDLIHAHVVLPAGWVAMRLGKEYNVPVVLTEHTGPFSLHLAFRSQRSLVREVLAKVNRVVAVSPALEKQIHSFLPNVPIDVVGNVIRTDLFVPSTKGAAQLAASRVRFLFVGVLNKQKGLGDLLQATHLLVQHGTQNFEVIIGGDGPHGPFLRETCGKLGLSKHCRFVGGLTRPEVKEWMQVCDVFVLPSRGETFGVVLGEAMACGMPVIATRCGGPEFVVTPETGCLVNMADPSALAEAMAGFTSGRFRFNGGLIRESITKRFGPEAFVRNISAVYERVWADQRAGQSNINDRYRVVAEKHDV